MRGVLAFERQRCLGCKSCELACAVEHSLSKSLEGALCEDVPPVRRVRVRVSSRGFEAYRCDQCEEPLCVMSCKAGAIRHDPASGRVSCDDERCVACLMCVMVCPFGVRPHPVGDRVVRCDVCEGRDVPACVQACPTHALAVKQIAVPARDSGFTGRLVVVGSSAAGIAACEAARAEAPRCAITLITADQHLGYSRPLLAYLLAAEITDRRIDWRDPDFLTEALNLQVIHTRVTGLNTGAHTVHTENGGAVGYDRLIIATGGRAIKLGIPGEDRLGVHPIRDLEDVAAIERNVAVGARAVVLGGGNVGLQACEAFVRRGMTSTVVVRSPYLLSQMVDAEAGRRVGELFSKHGVTVRTGRDAVAILGSERATGVQLDNGDIVETDVVVVGKGVQPNVEWLVGSGVEVRRGVVVDRHGRTSVPDVFAAGDCAELPDPIAGRTAMSGIWPVAFEGGRVAGSMAVGFERQSAGALRMNASTFFGLRIISMGEPCPEKVPGAVQRVLVDLPGAYRKVIVRDGHVVGALLLGDISWAGVLFRLYRDGVKVGDRLATVDDQDLGAVLGPMVDRPGLTGSDGQR